MATTQLTKQDSLQDLNPLYLKMTL